MVRIELAPFLYNSGDEFTVYHLADIHKQNPNADIDLLKKDLSDVNEKSIIIGDGDWFDSIALTDKRYTKISDDTKSMDIVNECVDELAKVLKPYRKQIYGIGIGNHEWSFIKHCNADPVKFLIKDLSNGDGHTIHHLGYSSFVRLKFKHKAGGNVKTIDIHQHHGWGNCITEGGNITKFERHARDYIADIHVYAHVHNTKIFKEISTKLGLSVRNIDWSQHKEYLIITGSYLKTLNDSIYPAYGEPGGYRVAPLGCKKTKIILHHDRIEIKDGN